MNPPVDLDPATRRMAELVIGVPDELLGAPTPCPAYRVGDLLDHISGLALAFTAAATKAPLDAAGQGPAGDAGRLGDDWRGRIPRSLFTLAHAWRDPAAWTGTTRAGGVDLPGEVAGLVALDEVVVHGWDLARATGQRFTCDDHLLKVLHEFLAPRGAPGAEPEDDGPFGPVVDVADDAPLLDRLLGLTGRDPAWSPS